MDPFSLFLWNVRVVRKQNLRKHLMVLRLSNNQLLTISMPSCKRPRILQKRQRGRSSNDTWKDMMANLREHWSNGRNTKRTFVTDRLLCHFECQAFWGSQVSRAELLLLPYHSSRVLSDLVCQVISGDRVLVAASVNPMFCWGFLLLTALVQSEASRTTCIQQKDELRAVSLGHNSLYIERICHHHL